MEERKALRLIKAGATYNVSHLHILEALKKARFVLTGNPNEKLSAEMIAVLDKEFGAEKASKIDLSQFETDSKKDKAVNLNVTPTEKKIRERKLVKKKGHIPVTLIPYFDEKGENVFLRTNIDLDNDSSDNALTKGIIGKQVESNVVKIVAPSQIITQFPDGYVGRLSIADISWCFPDAEEKFGNLKIGETIKCIVLDIDTTSKQIILSQKHLTKPVSDTIKWDRIERGDEYTGNIIETLHDTCIIKTNTEVYGLLHKSFISKITGNVKVKVDSKLDKSDLLFFVPASLEIDIPLEDTPKIETDFNFVEADLISYSAFKRSLLGISANDKDHEIISEGFSADKNIFSKEISFTQTLYIQFELNSPHYESTFKQNALPFFLDNALYTEENEKKLLEILANKNYWFKINHRYKDNKTDFSLYNEDVNFFGEVRISKDKKECRFVIKNFSFGHSISTSSDAKKRNAKYGSFLFASPLKVLSPFGSLPVGPSQMDFFEYALLKSECFETVNRLKKSAGEILRQEGRTLAIIDKFLEYQMSLIDEQKENNVFVDKYEKIPSSSGGVSIKISLSVGDSIELEEETTVNVRVKQDDGLLKLTDGQLSYFQGGCKITFNREVNLSLLDEGFYLDKRISKRQFQVQREIIQDFLEKKIKIDHIESLLVRPDKVKTPILSKIKFLNPDLIRTEIEQPDNNQVKAVKKAVGNQNIFLVQGPPGTGKTTVIAEIIQQLVAKGEKILVSGQNHVAVDNVLGKIAKIYNLNLLRVGNPERIDKDLVRYSIDFLIEDFKVDFKTFLSNQLLLSKNYLELRKANPAKGVFVESFNQEVNERCAGYGKLRELYKQRHFILRDGLDQLETGEIINAITSLENWIEANNNEYEILLKPLIYSSVDVVFATCIGIKSDPIFTDSNFKFDTIIVDEAGKANIAETLVAIELGKKVILVGDQMQLPPYMDSSLIDERDPASFPKSTFGADFAVPEIIHALKTSFFEFIVNKIEAGQFPKENKEMLNYQHRMHPNIGEFVSNSFYGGLVQMGSRTHLNSLALPTPFNKEVIFFDTSNSKNPFEQNDGYSAKNNTEAEVISEVILPKLFENNISPTSIAIIAPYKSQVANIKQFIRNSSLCNFKNVDVATLDSFQGKEYDIIVFSFTRSSDHRNAPLVHGKKKFSKVGFLDDARRLNVAFSRAKKKLILVGNSVTLTDPRSHYDGLFNYTQLFTRLVELSNKEEIGNFVNIADLHDFKAPFEAFIEKYRVGDTITGQVKLVGKKSNTVFGLFVTIEKVDCLLPISFMPQEFKSKIETLNLGSDISVHIYDIDIPSRKVTLKLPVKQQQRSQNKNEGKKEAWNSGIKELKKGMRTKGKVINKVPFGYFVLLECGIQGLLHHNQIKGNKTFKLEQTIEVSIFKIGHSKQQISLSA